MRKLILLLSLFIVFKANSQALRTVDTTINSWKTIITYPAGYTAEADRYYPMMVFFPGYGEAGGSYAQLRLYGPHARIAGGWDATTTIAGVTHKWIVVSLSQVPGFDVNSLARTRINTLLTFLRVKTNGVAITGLSAGGHACGIMATEDPFDNTAPYGPFPYADGISAIWSCQGVQPDDNTDYLNKFKNYARNNRSGTYLGMWGTSDGSRAMPDIEASMNAAVANSAIVISSAEAHNGTAFNHYYGSSGGAAPFTYNIGGVIQDGYQWMLRQLDTTVYSPGGVDVSPLTNQTYYLPTTSTSITGVASGGTTPYTYAWTRISGPNTPTMTNGTTATVTLGVGATPLVIGTYVYRITVTDAGSATSFEEVTITVKYSTADLSISSNSPSGVTTTASLTSTTSPNHDIISTKWTKLSAPGYTPKKVVFIGSSTVAGYGTTGYVSGGANVNSFVSLFRSWAVANGLASSVINLGQSSTNIYNGMVTGYIPPTTPNDRSMYTPIAGKNLTEAFAQNADIIIISYPSNNYDAFTVTEVMTALRLYKTTIEGAGKVFFVSTCQPRPGFSPTEELKLIEFSDSIRAQFPNNYLEYYNPLADEINPQAFVPAYDFGDGVHSNDAGHIQLFNQTVAANIFKSFVSSTSAITTPTTNNTGLTSLTVGTHKFQVSIADNRGLAASSISTVTSVASPCNVAAPVTYTLNNTGTAGEIYRPSGASWKGGDTVKITGTSYPNGIEFYDIHGDECRPLVIIPSTKLGTLFLRLKGGTSYIKVLGGDSLYGIKVDGNPLSMEKVHHIEIDNVETTNGSTGFWLRFDVDYADQTTWYPNFPMAKIAIKNSWVHDIGGEGMYIGNTSPGGYHVTSPYTGDTVIHSNRLDTVEIANCIVERTTWDAIQVSNSRTGNKIHHNIIRNYGTLNISSQQAGIILGGNCMGDIYNNSITKGSGNGIQYFGYGQSNIYNNLIDSAGYSGRTSGAPLFTLLGDQSIYTNDNAFTPAPGEVMTPAHSANIYNNIIKHYQNCEAVRVANGAGTSANSSTHDNQFLIPGATTGWQALRILQSPGGSTEYNNTLISTVPPASFIRIPLTRFKQL
jgi:lysophospholipase L1-like esterase